jgi:prophage regulatory protein
MMTHINAMCNPSYIPRLCCSKPQKGEVQMEAPTPDRLLKIDEVLELVAVGKTKLYRMLKDGEFPPAVRLGSRSVAWRRSDVERWISEL